jgi:hypothetical protein
MSEYKIPKEEVETAPEPSPEELAEYEEWADRLRQSKSVKDIFEEAQSDYSEIHDSFLRFKPVTSSIKCEVALENGAKATVVATAVESTDDFVIQLIFSDSEAIRLSHRPSQRPVQWSDCLYAVHPLQEPAFQYEATRLAKDADLRARVESQIDQVAAALG